MFTVALDQRYGDLGSSAARRGGSSPPSRTSRESLHIGPFGEHFSRASELQAVKIAL